MIADLQADLADRASSLYAEGVALLDAAWDESVGLIRDVTPYGVFHTTRGSLTYAHLLLKRNAEGDAQRAVRIINIVATTQETRADDAHYGNFRWFFEDAVVTDLNAVEFVLDHLNVIIREDGGALPPASLAALRDMIALGLGAIDRLDVHPSYTNIALSDICNSVLGGEGIDDPSYVERGRRRLDEWWEFTNRSGPPHEYNSPTYLAVDIMRMASLAEHTRDTEIALKARMAEERLWLHVAAHYAPTMAQLAGPHSRSYRDGWTGAGGLLKLLMWLLLGDENLRRPTPYYPQGREEGHAEIAAGTFHCPGYVLEWLRSRTYPFAAAETSDAARGADIATYITPNFALGTATASYGVGEPPEAWPAPNSVLLQFAKDDAPGYGVLYARYIVNDKEPGDGDHYEEGRYVGAQHATRAIVAYGLLPRLRPATSFKASIRLLGLPEPIEVWAGDRRIDNGAAQTTPGEPIVIAAGRAYIAIIPLEPSDMGSGAPIVLTHNDGGLSLDIYNYRGPAKTFWEHRSQGGPFYRGNVRNAFIIEAADAPDFASLEAFRHHIGAAHIADSVDDAYIREIIYASAGGSIAMRYGLWDMQLINRSFDGQPYVAPMARAGSPGGPQFIQSRESLIELANARLLAGRTPKWLFADDASGRYTFANPSPEAAPVWLETPRTVVECAEFGFGRIEVDDATGDIAIEAIGEIGPVSVRRDGAVRLHINGADVSGSLSTPDHDGMRTFLGL